MAIGPKVPTIAVRKIGRVSWAYLCVGVLAAILGLAAVWPLRGRVGSGLSFLPSWVVSEAPVHVGAVIVAATAGFGLAGVLTSWPGQAGLALCAIACGCLTAQLASGVRSRRPFLASLREIGQQVPEWRWTAQDTRRVAGLLPLRPKGGVEVIRNVSYSEDGRPAHRLDVYRKAGPGRTTAAPVLLYFHGGAWVMGDKRDQGLPMLEHLAERGHVCITANYSLSPKSRWPQHMIDCRSALGWVRTHIAEYGGDPNLIFVAGGSAGGHLASLLALTVDDAQWRPEPEEDGAEVAGCVALYGVYDFTDTDRGGNPNLGPLLRRRVFETASADALAAASPISRVGGSVPPFLVVHGRNDVVVPISTARSFVGALRSRSTKPVVFVELPLAQHAFDNFWSPRTVNLVRAVEHFTTGIAAIRGAQREAER